MLWVNRNTLVATRKHLATQPGEYRHIVVYVYDADDVLLEVLTTDSNLDGDRYSDTDIYYQSDKVLSWDNANGFITFGIELDPQNSYFATYFYEADDYEYTAITLNPLQNKDAGSLMWVYYVIPNVDYRDKAIHTLGVDQDGIIVYASQPEGRTFPSLRLTDEDGKYNKDTVIGMKYNSLVDSDNFVNTYTVPYVNEHQYYVLAEVVVMDAADPTDSIIFDVRRTGNVIKENKFEDAIRANPKILQSHLGCGIDGQVVPENNLLLIRAPVTLLEDFGGVLSPEKAERLLKKYLPAADSGLVHWDYKMPALNGYSTIAGQVDLEMSWEGPGLTYNLYRKVNPVGEFKLISEIELGQEDTVEYIDNDDLESGVVYYYGVRVVENGIELPFGNKLGVMVM